MSSQPPKDFLALSHGHEWVNFYESFDKLVQDHLSRSSELLRKAMSLPEVADREVAQIRDDLEGQLTAERAQNHATLSVLRQEIASSHQQMSSLVQIVAGLTANLERLTASVDSAIERTGQSETSDPMPESEPNAGDTAFEEAASESAPSSAPAQDWAAEVSGEEPRGTGDLSWDELASAAENESDGEIDLSALAEIEADTTEGESDDTGTVSNEAERVRPHWLSMARSSSN